MGLRRRPPVSGLIEGALSASAGRPFCRNEALAELALRLKCQSKLGPCKEQVRLRALQLEAMFGVRLYELLLPVRSYL